MKIVRIESWQEHLPLTRPYAIATQSIDAVTLFFVRLVSDGLSIGLGSGSPAPGITGETPEACAAALDPERLDWLRGRDPRHLGGLCRELGLRLADTPAARAALDMALHDLFACHLGVSLVDLLGHCHQGLETSITIGIMSTEEALAEADEYLGRGFRCLKVKIGLDFETDGERLAKLRERVGSGVRLRVDANQGYTLEQTARLEELISRLDLELVEQPVPAAEISSLRRLPPALVSRIAADESLHDERDALALVQGPPACGIFNVKLMKCGGVTPALGIAHVAELSGRELMWGCMDESALSLAAALHAAYACPATRYLDLDGNFDLARDLATGGYRVEEGRLVLGEEPGLGVRLAE